MSDRFYILAVDGGGFRGAFSAHLLKRMEESWSIAWRERFGMFAGTSTGSIIAAGLATDFAPPLGPCPCGSGRKLQDCHGPKLDELRPHYWPEMFEHELREMIEMARNADIDLPERDVLPAKMWKQKQRRQQKQQRSRKRR